MAPRAHVNRAKSPIRPPFELIHESDLVETLAHRLALPSTHLPRPRTSLPDQRARTGHQRRPQARAQRNRHSRSAEDTRSKDGYLNGTIPPLSPIDALASVAVQASRPTFTNPRPPTQSPIAPPYSPTQWAARNIPPSFQSHPDERPAKRARSEVLPAALAPSPTQLNSVTRPYTSHSNADGFRHDLQDSINAGSRLGTEDLRVPTGINHGSSAGGQDQRLNDAELLLGFFIAAKHSVPTDKSLVSGDTRSDEVLKAGADHVQNPVVNSIMHDQGTSMDTFVSTSQQPTTITTPQVIQEAFQAPVQHLIAGADSQSSWQTHTPPDDILFQQTQRAHIDASSADDISSTEAISKQLIRAPAETIPSLLQQELSKSQLHLQSPQSLPTDTKDLPSPDNGAQVSSRAASIPVSETKPPTVEEVLAALSHSIHLPDSHSSKPKDDLIPPITETVASTTKPRKRKEDITRCAACEWEHGSFSSGEYVNWLQCNGCKLWYHLQCAGFTLREVRKVDKYYCTRCRPKFGKTTFVRKSARSTTSVDYAGLNEGVLRLSDETPEHHYIRPIKDGSIQFDPESFPRMPPEELTAQFFEGCDSISEPIVIPAYLNPPQYRNALAEELTMNDADGADISEDQPLADILSSTYEQEMAPDNGQDKLGMVIPRGLTVRRVAQLHGIDMPLEVIDVKNQEGDSSKKWTVGKWADYYESTGEKIIRNVISLEVSKSPLGRLIQRPQIVRDLDLQDSVWPASDEKRVSVGFYCLMSVADSFTDFHIDFGGSSVFYHIVRGKKTFFFIPPTKSNLKKYEDWCRNRAQASIFLPDSTKDCYRVDLSPGDTMIIPSGWIHAVWTPEDSLVIGGNFLTRLHYSMQLRIAEIERNTKVGAKFKYPYFQKVLWYTLIQYLEQDPVPDSVRQQFYRGDNFNRLTPTHMTDHKDNVTSDEDSHFRHYPKAEIDGLPDLVTYILRTVMIHLDRLEGVSQDARRAVSRSIPKKAGEPLEAAKQFAMWVAWKRGNEFLPLWAHPNGKGLAPAKSEDEADKLKRLTAAEMKKLERQAPVEGFIIAEPPAGVAESSQEVAIAALADSNFSTDSQVAPEHDPEPEQYVEIGSDAQGDAVMLDFWDGEPADDSLPTSTPKTSVLGPRRTACDVCRKRKMRCKHMGDPNTPSAYGKILAAIANQQVVHTPEQIMEVDPTKSNSNGVIDTPDSKRGRSKACNECRRSKRRCIHDEQGNVDPVKQAEPVVPRGSASTKKRKSSVSVADLDAMHKRIKIEATHITDELTTPMANMARPPSFDSLADFSAPVAPMFSLHQSNEGAIDHMDDTNVDDFSAFINLEHSSPTLAATASATLRGPNGVGKVMTDAGSSGELDFHLDEHHQPQVLTNEVEQSTPTDIDDAIDPDLQSYLEPLENNEAVTNNVYQTDTQSEKISQPSPSALNVPKVNGLGLKDMNGVQAESFQIGDGSITNGELAGSFSNGDREVINLAKDDSHHSDAVNGPIPSSSNHDTPPRARAVSQAAPNKTMSTSPEASRAGKVEVPGSARRKSFSVKPLLRHDDRAPLSLGDHEDAVLDDPSMRLAMELQAEEFGLRRRRS